MSLMSSMLDLWFSHFVHFQVSQLEVHICMNIRAVMMIYRGLMRETSMAWLCPECYNICLIRGTYLLACPNPFAGIWFECFQIHMVSYNESRFSCFPLCYFKIIALALNMELVRNKTLGSNWIDLKSS